MTLTIAGLCGVLAALTLLSANRRSNGSKVRQIIERDQRLLAGLAPGTPAAITLESRIQATTLVYATGWVTRRARVRAALSSLALLAVVVVVAATSVREGLDVVSA